MNLKAIIRKEIAIQKSIEGDKCQDEILLKFLDAVATQLQWNLFVHTTFYVYGKKSYECYRFYYPTNELLKLFELRSDNNEVLSK